jgi:sec-independent protein translocase protein TatA
MLTYGFVMGWEWIIALVIVLLIFGSRLPSLFRNMGKGLVEFKKGMKEVEDIKEDIRRDITSPAPPQSGEQKKPQE